MDHLNRKRVEPHSRSGNVERNRVNICSLRHFVRALGQITVIWVLPSAAHISSHATLGIELAQCFTLTDNMISSLSNPLDVLISPPMRFLALFVLFALFTILKSFCHLYCQKMQAVKQNLVFLIPSSSNRASDFPQRFWCKQTIINLNAGIYRNWCFQDYIFATYCKTNCFDSLDKVSFSHLNQKHTVQLKKWLAFNGFWSATCEDYIY